MNAIAALRPLKRVKKDYTLCKCMLQAGGSVTDPQSVYILAQESLAEFIEACLVIRLPV